MIPCRILQSYPTAIVFQWRFLLSVTSMIPYTVQPPIPFVLDANAHWNVITSNIVTAVGKPWIGKEAGIH